MVSFNQFRWRMKAWASILLFTLITSSLPLSAPILVSAASRPGFDGALQSALADTPLLSSPAALPSSAMLQATGPDLTHKPLALANPITVTRVQSAAVAASALNSTMTITFTIRNNMPR